LFISTSLEAAMRVVVAGSRRFTDYAKLKAILDDQHDHHTPITVVISGTARGADTLGERWGHERGVPVIRFPALWDLLGKRAGYVRNEQMAMTCDGLIAFWVEGSKGTQHMIDLARKHNKPVRIIK
jgi:hypothetical protein